MQGIMSLGFEGGIMRGLKQRQRSLWSENLITQSSNRPLKSFCRLGSSAYQR